MTAPLVDLELLRRHDRPGPRYTSYPTAPHFHDGFGAADLRQAAARSQAADPARPLSLYVHVPFCTSPCFYCGCNRVITRDRARGQAYADRLNAEIALAAGLFDRARETIQVHFGGGSPNFLDPGQLGALLERLGAHFGLSARADRDFSIEVDPRLVQPADVAALAAIGFNRISLGVQDLDPAVQRAVNRLQDTAQILGTIDAARRHGMRSVNVDLIYGLPRQTLAGFRRTLDTLLVARPERIAVYSYAHLPAMFRAQRRIDEAELPSPAAKLGLLQCAIDTLCAAGYVYIGMDHFALPGDELALAQARGALHRNFMGYTTHAGSDLLGLGVSAISHVGDSFSQNPRDLPAWEARVDAGRLPTWRGLRLDDDDILRAAVIQQWMCHGRIDPRAVEAEHGIVFADYFAQALERMRPLADDGLVVVGEDRIEATPRGRLLLRTVAMCFDRYLPAAAPAATGAAAASPVQRAA
ncbi:oxygen-independent coproporphyrinogen III oxidase [Luteimonas huabeiensis]|uniref:oxygen-independent coproporphyrinogen III oxidase n=1 Tax=Luteimonas huabeiensis TaxID=1244513 RepID=UPI000694EFD6|nr:oxygen-independent coproporphyrinogen III oxidase [Luteimonas huabeiensis]